MVTQLTIGGIDITAYNPATLHANITVPDSEYGRKVGTLITHALTASPELQNIPAEITQKPTYIRIGFPAGTTSSDRPKNFSVILGVLEQLSTQYTSEKAVDDAIKSLGPALPTKPESTHQLIHIGDMDFDTFIKLLHNNARGLEEQSHLTEALFTMHGKDEGAKARAQKRLEGFAAREKDRAAQQAEKLMQTAITSLESGKGGIKLNDAQKTRLYDALLKELIQHKTTSTSR